MFALPYYLIWMEKALKATTVLVFAAVLSACAHSVKQPLDGAWTLETVNGVKQEVTIRGLEPGFLYFHHSAQHLSGKYEVYGTKLKLEEADNPRTKTATIEINSDNQLTITDAPSARLTEVRYLGATISRKSLN